MLLTVDIVAGNVIIKVSILVKGRSSVVGVARYEIQNAVIIYPCGIIFAVLLICFDMSKRVGGNCVYIYDHICMVSAVLRLVTGSFFFAYKHKRVSSYIHLKGWIFGGYLLFYRHIVL